MLEFTAWLSRASERRSQIARARVTRYTLPLTAAAVR